ncbi:MAG: PHB depolymerase family esterase [Bacteroidota bacterium]
MLLLGCGDSENIDPKDEGGDSCNNLANINARTITQAATTREYILHIPDSYDSSTPTPLLINFHGFGGCAIDYATDVGEFYNLNEVADIENFIVVYPQAIVREKEGAYWDPADNGAQDISDNDVYFTTQLIADIDKDYNLDLSRVYAAGYSNGGMMAYGLACSGSSFIAAVGIMSGTMLPATCNTDEYTSIIHFHGIADEVLPYEGNQDFQSISSVVDFWLDHNKIDVASLQRTELNNGDVIKEEYTGGAENTSLVLYTVNNEYGKEGGHVWFGDSIDGDSPNQILWDFLSQYSLDD